MAPFADAARQAQYEAVRAALAAAPGGAPDTLLLGNLAVLPEGLAVDALVVQPRQATALLLVPRGGYLRVPALAHGAWQLDGEPLAGRGAAPNPYAQFQAQKAAVAAWLGAQLGWPPGAPVPLAGAAVFMPPVTFGNEAEEHLRHTAGDFQLVRGAQQLPRRLRAARGGSHFLGPEALLALARHWQAAWGAPEAPGPELAAAGPLGFWGQQARQLWQWLGAADVPVDPPYGDAAAVLAQHEQLRRELLAELHQHRQAAARHQAAHEQEFAQLRAQLARPAAPAELPDQAVQAAAWRAEAAARNQALDVRIQQLGHLIEQLRAQAAAPAGHSAAARAAPAGPRAQAARAPARQPARGPWQVPVPPRVAARVAARLAAGLAVAAGLGLGGWSLLHPWGPVRAGAPQLAQMAPAVPLTGATNDSDEGLADSAQARVFSAPDMAPAADVDIDVDTTVPSKAPAASEDASAVPALAAPDSVLDAPAVVPEADTLGPR
ncbi:hypothetical protein ACFQ48_03180 [Hymenobacter caeli]|uniref:NERD domain-containing protein n=1 Tax=Hymenobacter caeli TaxID=2735894 RepID=A0ABX2FMX0_9BACT|nr:hypothetical protein [Hymenobacter caeli]NRT17829.1 hypothetical protein [Hymenobacter caeli]